MFNKNSKKAKANKILNNKYLDELGAIARKVGLKPGKLNKQDLIQHILKNGNRKILYKELDLNCKVKPAVILAIILAVFAAIWNKIDYNPFKKNPVLECRFDNHIDTLHVLILPFNNRTDQNNAGEIIAKRLNKVVIQENLMAKVEYCRQFKNVEGLTKQKVTKIAEELNANLVIYGDMEKESCNDKKICLNWISTNRFDYETYNEYTLVDNNSYHTYSNSELRNGSLQEGIDYIVNFFAGQIAYQNNNYDKAFCFFKNKIQDELKIETCQVNTMLSYLYLHSLEVDSAQVYLNKSKIFCEEHLEVYYKRMNYIFHSALENFDSIYNVQPKLIQDYFTQTDDIKGTYKLLSSFIINNHALLRIRQNKELLNWFRERYYSTLSVRQKFFFMHTEYINLSNLGRIKSAEKKLEHTLIFCKKHKLHQGTLMSINSLRRLYYDTNQLLKLKKLEKEWANNSKFWNDYNESIKSNPKLPHLISEDDKIKQLITSNCSHIVLDSVLNNYDPRILKYRKYTKAHIYLSEGVRQFEKENLDIADSLFNISFNSLKKYTYTTSIFATLLYEKGNLSFKYADNARLMGNKILQKESLTQKKSHLYIARAIFPIDLYNNALEYLKNATRIYNDNELKSTDLNIKTLNELAYISKFDNLRTSKKYYENTLHIINNSEWKDSYLHSTVLLEYYDMLFLNYDSLNKKEDALKLIQECEKIRIKLLGSNHNKTKLVIGLRKHLQVQISSMKNKMNLES